MAGLVARIGKMKNAYSILVIRVEQKRLVMRSRHSQEDVHGLIWLRTGQVVSFCGCGVAGRMPVDLFGSEQGQMVGFSEYGNELLGFIKFGEFLDQLSICQLQKTHFAAWSQYMVVCREINGAHFYSKSLQKLLHYDCLCWYNNHIN